MENREQQILSEIKSMVASIRSQLEKLDAKMVEFHQAVDPEGFKTESINVIIDDIDMLAPPVETLIFTRHTSSAGSILICPCCCGMRMNFLNRAELYI